jgi:hypothetical protein
MHVSVICIWEVYFSSNFEGFFKSSVDTVFCLTHWNILKFDPFLPFSVDYLGHHNSVIRQHSTNNGSSQLNKFKSIKRRKNTMLHNNDKHFIKKNLRVKQNTVSTLDLICMCSTSTCQHVVIVLSAALSLALYYDFEYLWFFFPSVLIYIIGLFISKYKCIYYVFHQFWST